MNKAQHRAQGAFFFRVKEKERKGKGQMHEKAKKKRQWCMKKEEIVT